MSSLGRHVKGAETRERVLDAAAKLISTHGYAATSIAKISKESGTNSASIYWAFENKETLFAAVMERAADAFFEATRSVRPDSKDPWRALVSLSDYFEGGPEFLRLECWCSRSSVAKATQPSSKRPAAFAPAPPKHLP